MKKLNTKLTLNKESVASLNDSEMRNVIGGGMLTRPRCNTGGGYRGTCYACTEYIQ
jgi:natural product precursor